MQTTKKILLVEDNPGDAELIKTILHSDTNSGFSIHVEERLSSAVSFLSDNNVDIVLLDLGLPDSQGLGALIKIKQAFPHIPVIVITGNEDESVGVKAVQNGAQDYILKGLIPRHYLIQTIDYAIQRQESEFKLRQSEEKYRSIVENIGIGVALLDKDRKILETNNKLQQWFSALAEKKEQTCFQSIACMCNGSGKTEHCPVKKTLADGRTHKATLKNERRTYQLLSSPLNDKKSRAKGAILLIEDITDRVSIEKKLRQAQKMESLGTLAGGVAHDFNNILTAIKGFASLAAYDAADPDQLKDDLNEIIKASERASDLVRQILTFSRMAEFEKKPIRIDLIVKETLKLLRSTLPASIEIQSRVEKITDMVIADPTQIHQIMMNLGTNAAYAMEVQGGRLTVTLQKKAIENRINGDSHLSKGPYLKLVVEDTGCGIPEDILDSIFDPYFTTKSMGDGTGLGLSVVQGIVRDTGGEIQVSSKINQGSSFSLFFPVAEKTAPLPVKKASIKHLNGNEHILVIDDEPPVLSIVERILEKFGYQIHMEPNGCDAMKYLEKNHKNTDLILSDMTMPKMTGLELSKKIKALDIDIPVIIMTGYSRLLSPEAVADSGIAAVVEKPIAPELFVQKIRETLDHARLGSVSS